jgi:hypothetical protein
MTQVNEKVQKVLDTLSKEELKQTLSGLTNSLLSGTPVEYESVYIRFTLPKDIMALVVKACKPMDVNPEEVLSKMASDGFNKEIQKLSSFMSSLDEEVKKPLKENQVKFETPKTAVLPDVEKLMGGLGQLQSLAQQLQEMQKMVENGQLLGAEGLFGPGNKNSSNNP